ncbi:uncharacterized protein PHACADRAFT_265464 [Phanerochaete carnosa HHB-10118-sp]|uniref:Uncharacterized protein n=1 Tax=Phanerochaete carnosa (strain HHB-10118-sp) TaxID=650164 RepID=K5UJP1_PHACS|nr:uncharacterized protein PHACADRAFT_265464 [Phanerochaete carnosa HHB-10118-sp]EKM49781.1 hypothetical protein PHACADRAFT_265464 [Phanerochaete carnosa HHB-10118-sp]
MIARARLSRSLATIVVAAGARAVSVCDEKAAYCKAFDEPVKAKAAQNNYVESEGYNEKEGRTEMSLLPGGNAGGHSSLTSSKIAAVDVCPCRGVK